MAAVKPNGANTFLAHGNATFINGPAYLLNNFLKILLIVLFFLFVLYLILYQLLNYY